MDVDKVYFHDICTEKPPYRNATSSRQCCHANRASVNNVLCYPTYASLSGD